MAEMASDPVNVEDDHDDCGSTDMLNDVEYSPPSPARETATGGAVGGWGHAR